MSSLVEAVRPIPAPSLARAWQWRLYVAGLVLGDLLSLLLGLLGAFVARFQNPWLPYERPYSVELYLTLMGLMVSLGLLLLALFGLYDRHNLLGGTREYARVLNAVSTAILVVVLVSFVVAHDSEPLSRGWLSFAWLFMTCALCLNRFSLRRAAYRLRERGLLTTRTVIIGANAEAVALAEQLVSNPKAGVELLGFVADGPSPPAKPRVSSGDPLPPDNGGFLNPPLSGGRGAARGRGPELGIVAASAELAELVHRERVEELIVATTAVSHAQLLELFRQFAANDAVEIRMSSGLFEILTTGMRIKEVAAVPLVSVNKVRLTGAEQLLKQALDLGLLVASAFVVLPIMLAVALAVRLDSPGPIVHRRRVLGLHGRPFDALKFRTMVADADAQLERLLAREPALRAEWQRDRKLKVDPRVTRVGAFLRRYSLDELPQWVNVLRGEMSFVGPRMIAPDEAERYGSWKLNLLTVKPGLTGPWQVRGRNALPYDERVRLSMHYIRNYTLWLDLHILFRTIPVVIRGEEAY